MVAVGLAAPNDGSAQAGEAVARAGGNAVDVALAAMAAALVSEPGISSLGGGAFVTIGSPSSDAVTIDGSVVMPGLGRVAGQPVAEPIELFLEYGGGTSMQVGPASVAVPGTLPAMELAHWRYGQLPWAEVIAPAAQLARDGFLLGSAAAHYLGFSGAPLFGLDPAAAAALTGPDGQPLRLGDRMRMPELADFLDRVAVEGADALMAGDVAKGLVEQMTEQGGLLTMEDLAQYQPVVRAALPMRQGGWSFATNPGPAVGGPVLAAMLMLLSPGSASAPDAPDAAGVPVPVAELFAVQREILTYRVRELDRAPDRVAAAAALLARVGGESLGLGGPGPKAPSTVHVSAVDAGGLACAITASAGYGSGVSAPGTGVWLNNCLGEPELNRGKARPGERLVSNMTPTVGRHDDGRVLAIGSPGADRIATAVLQTVLGLVAGDSLAEAVRRPRLHVNVRDDGTIARVEYESDLAGVTGLAPDLEWRAHDPLSMFFGGVGAALLGADGSLTAAADPRRDGAVVITG